jgi:Zn-dependent metalloprotease/PKD repeat protein
MMKSLWAARTAAAIALTFSIPFTAQALPLRLSNTHAEAIAQLTQAVGGALNSTTIEVDHYNTVHATGSTPLLADDAAQAPLIRAQNFLTLYGAVAGVQDAVSEFQLSRISRDEAGNTHVHMDQRYQGLPVFGARMVVHMNDAGITGTNGVFIAGLDGLDITPQQDTALLNQRAIAAATKLHPGKASSLAIESTRLMIYNTGILQSLKGSNRLAYEVMVSNGPSGGIRERMILDANNGLLLNRINEIHSILNRKIYTPVLVNPATGTESTPVFTEKSTGTPADPVFAGDTKGSPASSRTHGPGTEPLENLYIYAGGTWLLYKNLLGADGYDFTRPPKTGQVQKSVYLANDQCPNAYWDGTSTNYCPGFDADDVVSHEWSHAYTEYTHGLVYQYQSGALNESYSDIFGETYDLVDGFEGPLGASLTEGTTYDKGGSRWVVGEDLSQAAAILLLRDMWDPDTFPTPSPGSTNTSANYACGTSDNGGVHTNSGVSNHAYAMLVDGKTFNGVTVPGIGLTKASHIYFQAETHYQTPTTNYAQHADALAQSCKDLIGVPLNDVFGKVSTEKITQADCDAVDKDALAVEFRKSVTVKCNYVTVLKPEASTPALCPTGKYVTSNFSEGFDAAALPAAWTQGKNLKGDLDIAGWTTSQALPAPHMGSAAFFKNDKGGTCTTGGDQSASHYLDTPAITVKTAADFYTFTHFMQSESGFDGGNLKYSLNGGAFALVPAAAFTYNGHSSKFNAGPVVAGAPGQVAWTGSDQGEATGSWGTTIVDLSKLTTAAKAGDKVKFRYDFANDGCGGNLGWFIDSVKEFYCSATPPPNTLPVASITADKTTGDAPLSVQFMLSGTDADTPNGDKVVSFAVSYGEGSAVSSENYASGSSSKVAAHTYNTPGTYTVSLTVTDSFGGVSAPVTQKIVVTSKAGTVTPSMPVLTASPVVTTSSTSSKGEGRFGGGSLGLLTLMPLMGFALRRRRR